MVDFDWGVHDDPVPFSPGAELGPVDSGDPIDVPEARAAEAHGYATVPHRSHSRGRLLTTPTTSRT